TVRPTYGLSDAQVEQMLQDSFDHAEADFTARFLAEARTEADALIRATRKALSQGRHLISDEVIVGIDRAVSELENSLSATDRTILRAKIDALNTTAQPLAEELMNEAARTALKGKNLAEETSRL